MIRIDIPGFRSLKLHHLVLDYNGTLALDGDIIDGVPQRLSALSTDLTLHVVTAETFGKARDQLEGIAAELLILPADGQDKRKLEYVSTLGASACVCIGNGRNDRLMLREAALGIAVIGSEGCAIEAHASADVACASIADALDLLLHPHRLIATLRS
jgi:soluble P-type ATPase